jgi:outer membrane protein
MQKLLKFAAVMAGLLLMSAPLAAQSAKIGYIDSRRVIQEAPGAQEARQTLEREMSGYQTQLRAMEDSMQTLLTDYQQKSVMLSADAKKQREQELTQKQTAFQQRAQSMQESAGQRQQQLMKPIMDRIQAVISELRQQEGYAIIFDMAAEAMVAADPSLDLTTKVIERLRAGSPAAATAAPRN